MSNLNPMEKARIAAAKDLTAAQIQDAKALHVLHFNGSNSPEILAAIISAMATNYAAAVISNDG